jgi:D-glycero-D-manno-heptose 1,7-bisphosphate phosphatase
VNEGDPLRRAVFLDRDGTISKVRLVDGKPHPPARLEDFELLPGVVGAVRRLKEAGFLTIVATNQPDVARGLQPRTVVEAMHDRLKRACPVDAIYACFEEDGPDCRCYKPKPGMLLEAAADFGIDLGASYVVGDRWRDVGAGRNAGCRTILIEADYAERRLRPDRTARDLAAAVDTILSEAAESA